MRRSSRLQSCSDKLEREWDFLKKVAENSHDGLTIVNNDKGRAIEAMKEFNEGDFVATYEGDLVAHKEALQRYLSIFYGYSKAIMHS